MIHHKGYMQPLFFVSALRQGIQNLQNMIRIEQSQFTAQRNNGKL